MDRFMFWLTLLVGPFFFGNLILSYQIPWYNIMLPMIWWIDSLKLSYEEMK